MASGKDPSPLFDIVRRSRRPKRSLELPDWMRRQGAQQAQQPTAETQPATEKPTRATAEGLRGWWQKQVAFRLPRGTLAMLIAGGLVVVILAYLIGHRIGRSQSLSYTQTYEQMAQTLEPVRQNKAQGLIPSSVEGVDEADSIGVPNVPGASGAGDPREPGLNYFRLTSIPASADEVGRMIDFLAANGVDAAAIPINNGRSVKVLAMRGFTNPLSDPQAQAYAERLKRLGRKWKAEHRGSSNWKDLYPEKYRPGRN